MPQNPSLSQERATVKLPSVSDDQGTDDHGEDNPQERVVDAAPTYADGAETQVMPAGSVPMGPLGSGTVLPPPTGEAARRGAALFRRLLAEQTAAKESQEDVDALQGRAPALPPAGPRPHGRSYPVLWQIVASASAAQPGAEDGLEAETAETSFWAAQDVSHDDQVQAVDPAAADGHGDLGRGIPRPPVGRVRPSVPAPKASPDRSHTQERLEASADGLRWEEGQDGGKAFEIDFKHDVFADLRCRIETGPQGVSAIFFVQDDNTRRLLEAEKDHLRVALEGRGLRVSAVSVVSAASGR